MVWSRPVPRFTAHLKEEGALNSKECFTVGHLFRNTVRTQVCPPNRAPTLGSGHTLAKAGEGYGVNEKHLGVRSPRCCQLCLGC